MEEATSAAATLAQLGPNLHKLWSYSCNLTKGRNVSCMAWNKLNPVSIYILLDVLVCSIAEYFYELRCILTSPPGRVKIQTTSRNTQRYTPKHLISYLLSNIFALNVQQMNFKQPTSCDRLGTLRSTTATSTKTSPQNRTLVYCKSFAIIPSRSRRTMWAKYPKNKLVRAVSY